MREFNKICYVGAGTMGCYNALIAALSGYSVVLYDQASEVLGTVSVRQREIASMMVGSGLVSEKQAAEAFTRIDINDDLAAALNDADLISESVVENLAIKQALFAQLEILADEDAIITTNTSHLSVSDIQLEMVRGQNFAALHSHLGAPLIDIVKGPRTRHSTVEKLERYIASIHGVPLILKKEHPGYVFNNLLGSVLSISLTLLVSGKATVQIIDKAWMIRHNAPMGPFAMMDLFGLGLILDSWRNKIGSDADQSLVKNVIQLLDGYVDAGHEGMKSGKGFYSYPEPEYQQSSFLEESEKTQSISEVLTATLLLSAISLVELDVAEFEDVDMAWKVATYLQVGPFDILSSIGKQRCIELMQLHCEEGFCSADDVSLVRQHLTL